MQAPYGVLDTIPERGLYRLYLSLVKPKTAAPDPYHIASLTAVLSALVAPHIQLHTFEDGQDAKIDLHLWIMLCGESGNYKSYPADLAVEAADPFIGERKVTPSGSREGLEELFLCVPNALVHLDEAASFFAENRSAIMKSGDAFWNKLYDRKINPTYTRGKAEKRHGATSAPDNGKANDEPIGPYVSILMISATDGLLQSTRPHQWTGGLCSRLVFVDGDLTHDQPYKGDWRPEELTRVRDHFGYIERLAKAAPAVTQSTEASQYYRSWFARLAQVRSRLSYVYKVILNRLKEHALRIAAIYALSAGKTEIDLDTMRAACAFADHSRMTVLRLPFDRTLRW